MRVIIAGSRTIRNAKAVEQAIESSGFVVTEVICGMAEGVDMTGRQWEKRMVYLSGNSWQIGKYMVTALVLSVTGLWPSALMH